MLTYGEIKVSVIICSYNRTETVKQTIDSILNQKVDFPIEIIIGDDASTDGVREILKEYKKNFPDKIILVFHEKKIGLSANWASCIKICTGIYIAGCDNDDFWHNPEKLQMQVQFLEKNPEYGMIHTDYRELNRKTGKIAEKINHDVTYSEPVIQAVFYGRFKCCNSSVMYRRSVINKYVNLDDYISYQFPLQDWNTWINISKFTKFYCLPVSTTTIEVGNESITRPKDCETIKQRFEKEKTLYKYLCDKFPDDLVFDDKVYEGYVSGILLTFAIDKFDFDLAKKQAQKLTEVGYRNLKIIMSEKKVTFLIFALFKFLMKKLLI